MKKYHGIIPPIITPVDQHENVDEEGFRKLLEHCVQGGLHGIFVAGTNGETMQLTQKERNRACRIVIDQVAGRIPVLCGAMDCSTKRVIENIKELEQMGAACAVVTSIFYARHTSQDESVRHFEAISNETDIDVAIYNMPSMTGLTLTASTVKKIAEFDRVVAYKDSSPGYGAFLEVLEKFRNTPFACLQGVTPQAVSALLMGADGFVPALAPLFPGIFVDAFNAGISGDLQRARYFDKLIQETSKILRMGANMTAAAKFAISTLGFTDKRIIAPQDPITPEQEQNIIGQIGAVKELYEKGMDA